MAALKATMVGCLENTALGLGFNGSGFLGLGVQRLGVWGLGLGLRG